MKNNGVVSGKYQTFQEINGYIFAQQNLTGVPNYFLCFEQIFKKLVFKKNIYSP